MRTAVEFHGLSKRFGNVVAVDDLTGSIPAGELFGICGPNGAGKTTLLRMTTGLLEPDRGTVTVAGTSVWDDPVGAKRLFGLVPDNPRMFPRLTGRELLEFHGAFRGMERSEVALRADELLSVLAMTGDADVLIADYSLGMTKKVAIAAALLHDPQVLFLDEPFAGIDPVSRQVLERILARFAAAGGTVVFSDHAMDVVERLCSRIMIIDHGAVLAAGSTAELTGGRRLQEVFVELVGGGDAGDQGLEWLGRSSG